MNKYKGMPSATCMFNIAYSCSLLRMLLGNDFTGKGGLLHKIRFSLSYPGPPLISTEKNSLVLQYPLSQESRSEKKSRTQSPSTVKAGKVALSSSLFQIAYYWLPCPRVNTLPFSKPHVAAIGNGSPSDLNHIIAVVSNFPYAQKSYGKANRRTRSSRLPVTSRHVMDGRTNVRLG